MAFFRPTLRPSTSPNQQVAASHRWSRMCVCVQEVSDVWPHQVVRSGRICIRLGGQIDARTMLLTAEPESGGEVKGNPPIYLAKVNDKRFRSQEWIFRLVGQLLLAAQTNTITTINSLYLLLVLLRYYISVYVNTKQSMNVFSIQAELFWFLILSSVKVHDEFIP